MQLIDTDYDIIPCRHIIVYELCDIGEDVRPLCQLSGFIGVHHTREIKIYDPNGIEDILPGTISVKPFSQISMPVEEAAICPLHCRPHPQQQLPQLLLRGQGFLLIVIVSFYHDLLIYIG